MEELIKLIFRKTRGIDEDCDNDFNCLDCYCPSKMLASFIYEAGFRKIPDGAVILSPEEREEEMKAYNEERKERENELLVIQMACVSAYVEAERLKAENKQLQEQLNSANAGNVNCSGCGLVGTNAVKEFAEWAKDHITDVPFCNQKAYNIFCDMVNKKIKEYCND